MKKVFIDGSSGTVGLRLAERLHGREDIKLLQLPDALVMDKSARAEMLNEADIAFLCLPDDVAREAVQLCKSPSTVIIDASTAHRTDPDWTYGFPELSAEAPAKINASRRIAVPGCHASGFISLVYPLVKAGILSADAELCCFSLTGYSGGGKNMIAAYEAENPEALLAAPRQYGISQQHKHLPEMQHICGLEKAPCFAPIVADYYSGMETTVPLFASQLHGSRADIIEVYKKQYASGLVRFVENENEAGFLSACSMSGRDDMHISVEGNDERILLVSRFDNLGKGASGTAIECMNIVLGVEAGRGLVLPDAAE